MKENDFRNTFTYAALIEAMEKYDDYDPELIKRMTEDWYKVMKAMEDKQYGKES